MIPTFGRSIAILNLISITSGSAPSVRSPTLPDALTGCGVLQWKRGGRYCWEIPVDFNFAFDGQRTIQQVIISYYLAMRSFEIVGATLEQWANLWLRLVWIYEDLEEGELALAAAEKARDCFAEAMSTSARSAAGDQQLYILLGELELRLGNTGAAFNNFHRAATMTGGDPRHKRLAFGPHPGSAVPPEPGLN